ncbi:MAG: hypothetical protein KJN73_05495 [Acidimicrobiia bacterium]|nr:hypothetical protein [Acidimicrobiia bacterium]
MTPFVTVDVVQGGGPATGLVAVSLEEVGGFFHEGFEIGLRFENAEGEVIAATLWSDFVVSQGVKGLEDFYDSILEQVVPAGELVVLATVNVGIGPPPEVPDLGGDLRCRIEVVVPENDRVNIEVSFVNHENCLRLIPGGWQEPPDYSFVLDSSCGERTLIGRFAITVRDGRIAEVVAQDFSAEAALGALGPDGIPTLGELLDELNTARLQNADQTDVTFDPEDGHPIHIKIDWQTNVTDDEACYLISNYSATD